MLAGVSPEAKEAILAEGQEQAINLAAPLVGGAAGRVAAKPLSSTLRFLARGARGRREVMRDLAKAQRADKAAARDLEKQGLPVPEKQTAGQAIANELATASGLYALADLGPELVPGGVPISERGQEFAGFLMVMARLPFATRNILLSSPQFLRFALGKTGEAGTKVGALAGFAATQADEMAGAVQAYIATTTGLDLWRPNGAGPHPVRPVRLRVDGQHARERLGQVHDLPGQRHQLIARTLGLPHDGIADHAVRERHAHGHVADLPH